MPTLIISLERGIVNIPNKTSTTSVPGFAGTYATIFSGLDDKLNEEQKARVQELVEELDALVPRTDAVVVMNVYRGGCDESQITATENGYLRLGIELLKAPSALHFVDGKDIQLDVNLEGLVSEQSDINFYVFHLDNTLRPDTPADPHAKQPWPDKVIGPACGLVCLLLVYVLAVGVTTIGRWIFK